MEVSIILVVGGRLPQPAAVLQQLGVRLFAIRGRRDSTALILSVGLPYGLSAQLRLLSPFAKVERVFLYCTTYV